MALVIFLWRWLKPLWGAPKLFLCSKNPARGNMTCHVIHLFPSAPPLLPFFTSWLMLLYSMTSLANKLDFNTSRDRRREKLGIKSPLNFVVKALTLVLISGLTYRRKSMGSASQKDRKNGRVVSEGHEHEQCCSPEGLHVIIPHTYTD